MTKEIITISRQYGSAGREIGVVVAKKLGYTFYDREIIKRVAQENGLDADLVKEGGESLLGLFSDFVNSANITVGVADSSLPFHDRVFLSQSHIIKQIADMGPCVILGHSASFYLADHPSLLSVYVQADWDARVRRVMEGKGLNEHDAVARIRKIDRRRAIFNEQRTGSKWGMAANYHLSLSSSAFGIEGAADLIAIVATRY